MIECKDNSTSMDALYQVVTNEIWESWNNVTDYFEYQPWIFSLLGSAMVGLSGVFPLFIIPIDEGADLKHGRAYLFFIFLFYNLKNKIQQQ